MNIWARRIHGVVLITVTGLVAACALGSEPEESEPVLGPVPTIRGAADVVLPLDSYRMSQKEYLTVRRAAWRLIRDCVRRFGGEYTIPETAVVADVPTLVFDNERRYGLIDASTAASLGYNLPPDQLPPAEQKGADKRIGWNPTETEKLLVRGLPQASAGPQPGNGGAPQGGGAATQGGGAAPGGGDSVPTDTTGRPLPPGGCTGEADRLLAKGSARPPDADLASRLGVETFQRTERDSRVRSAMAKWSSCMKESGYSYRTIWEPNDRSWPDPASDEEIATARADVACKQRSGLVQTYFQVETAYQKRVIEQRAQVLETVQDFARTNARNAVRIVGGG